MVKTILMIKSEYLKFLKKKEVVGRPIVDKIGKLKTFYLPLSEWIYSIYQKDKKTKIIGLSGGQGAGKSTITEILKFILKKKYKLNLCVFSIDDFYKTKAERKKMSKNIHPLFLTRGVPGTHDVSLINKTIKKLKKRNFKTVLIPKFDKSSDDRSTKSKWNKTILSLNRKSICVQPFWLKIDAFNIRNTYDRRRNCTEGRLTPLIISNVRR